MKKLLILLIPFSLLLSPAHAQTWEPVGGGLIGDERHGIPVHALCVFENRLFVGGALKSAGKLQVNNIACWDGTKWSTVGTGTNDMVEKLYVFNNTLVAGGLFSKAGNEQANCIAYWANGWHTMGKLLHRDSIFNQSIDVVVLDLLEHKGLLYVVINNPKNSSQQASDFTTNILKWNGAWTQFGKVMPHYMFCSPVMGFTNGIVRALATDGENLFIGGYVGWANDMTPLTEVYQKVISSDGVHIKPLSNGKIEDGIEKGMGLITLMAYYDSSLYVAGYYSQPNNHTPGCCLVKWDGHKWSRVGKWKGDGAIYCMQEYKGKLYVGGDIDSISGKPANGIACWDGNTWEPVGVGFSTNKPKQTVSVRALCVYNDELYAAGSFTSSGGVPMMNIAKLNMGGTKSNPPKRKGMQPLGH